MPIWGRNHPDLEPLIGFFVNTLPIRCRFEPGLSFRQFLAQVRDSSIAAYEHQELPFEQIVEVLQLERDTSRHPLVQVMLQLLDLPEAAHEQLAGLQLEALPSGSDSAKFDLSLAFRRGGDQALQGSITYATDLFSADRIERLVAHLHTLLRSLLDFPDAAVSHLQLLPEAERQRIESWQQGSDMAMPEQSVPELFEQQARQTPDAIALVFEDQCISYHELNLCSTSHAHHLIQLGAGPEVIVAVSLQRSPNLVMALLSILKAGAAFLVIDPDLPAQRSQQLLLTSGASLLLSQADQPEQLPARCQHVDLRQQHCWDSQEAQLRTKPISLHSLAYVLYTSGSTGTPKAVAIDQRSLLHRSHCLAEILKLDEHTNILALTAPIFDISILELLIPLTRGAKICLANEEERKDPYHVERLIRTQAIQFLQTTPSYLKSLFNSSLNGLHGLRILAGGEAIPQSLARQLITAGFELWNGYGPTEATIYTTLAQLAANQPVHLGRPLPNVVVQILDPAGRPCPIGSPGELHIGGIGLARGYLHQLGLTAEKFIPDPHANEASARLYKSGDLASWNPDGTLAFHGRLDQQIKLRGVRIEPGEIEAQLLNHPALDQAVVLLRWDDPNNPTLVAYWRDIGRAHV